MNGENSLRLDQVTSSETTTSICVTGLGADPKLGSPTSQLLVLGSHSGNINIYKAEALSSNGDLKTIH